MTVILKLLALILYNSIDIENNKLVIRRESQPQSRTKERCIK